MHAHSSIPDHFRSIQARILASAKAAGRRPLDIGLIAVSKQQDEARVEAVLALGQRVFGENKVQEAKPAGLRAGRLTPICGCI